MDADPGGSIAARRTLDLHNPRTEIGEDLSGPRPRQHLGEFDHPDAR